MSLSESISLLLENHQKKVGGLSRNEEQSLDSIKKNIKMGLLSEVVSSIREFVSSHPEISEKISPGTVGSFLVGCLGSLKNEESVCSLEEQGIEESVFISSYEGITPIVITPSNRGSVYLSAEKTELSDDERRHLSLQYGISKIKVYQLNQEGEYTALDEIEEGSNFFTSLFQKSVPFSVVVLLFLVAFFFFYDKIFN